MYVTINVFSKGGNMRPKSNGEHFDFYQHSYGPDTEQEEKTLRLKTDTKDRVIHLLFGYVSDETRKELHDYMDARFERCHCLSLYITDDDRKKSDEGKSKFAVLCEKLGLDPGKKEVQVTDKLQVLYSPHYSVPGQPR